MWKSLADIYEKKGLPGQIFLKRKLMSMKLNENENLDDFLKKFEELICQINPA